MPEAIGKGIASYITSVKAVSSEPLVKELAQPTSSREPNLTRIVEIPISQEALERIKQ
tara:strand:+ start:1422 stop:1595 length:174 start_codon:yes stop_codon:yes gene_type:complete